MSDTVTIKKVKVHTCNQKIEGYVVDKCKCRRYVTNEKAEELIGDGFAAYVIKSLSTITVEEACPICAGTDIKKSCRLCGKSGKVEREKVHLELGEDIYMRPFLKTPRTATIEEEHIEYAMVKGDKDALKRIELYNDLNQISLAKLGAELRNPKTGEIVVEGTPEPEDDPEEWRGRNFDWGKSI
jgi:hypothetical protein